MSENYKLELESKKLEIESKKLEIESNERSKKLELESNERIKMKEIEYKMNKPSTLKKEIIESINEYTEDNWYFRTYWLVKEILRADDNIVKFSINEDHVAAGLRLSVHDAIEFKKSEIVR
jgi:hypothetical protein